MARKKTKSLSSRRRWRALYHRSRIYLPAVVLLFLAMVLYLPLSPAWLNRYVEGALRDATGLAITIEKTRVRLISAEVLLSGLAVAGEPGRPSFRIGEIALDGDFGELLAGGENWPAVVVVTNPSEVRLVRTDQGLAIRGDLETLLDALQKGKEKSDVSDVVSSPGWLGALRRATPAVEVRNATVVLDSHWGDLPPLKLAINRISVPRRVGSAEGMQAEVVGLAVANSAEPFRGTISLLPVEEQASIRFQLDGVEAPFRAPELGPLRASARDVVFLVQTVRSDPLSFALSADIEAGRFELSEDRPPGSPLAGGESWVEQDLKLTARGAYHLASNRIEATEIRLAASGVDLRASGIVKPEMPYQGKARVNVRRLPASAIRLAQLRAREAGFSFDRQTTATLNVELAAEGDFARPAGLDLSGSVRLAGWTVSQPSWPHPLVLRQASGTVDRSRLSLPSVSVDMGELTAQVSANLPILPGEGDDHRGEVAFRVRGDPAEALATAKRFGILPREINSVTMPLTLDVWATLDFADPLWNWDPSGLLDSLVDLDGSLTWGEGSLSLRDLAQPVHVESGSIRFVRTRADLSHLNASYGGVALNVDASLFGGDSLWAGSPDYELTVQAEGEIPEILALIERRVALPLEVLEIAGKVRARVHANGSTSDLAAAGYHTTVNLENVSGKIQFALDEVAVDRLNVLIEATQDSVLIPRFSARVDGDGSVEGSAEATSEALILRAQAEAPIGVAAKVTPKDFRDLYVEGRASAEATVTLSTRDPLPVAPDLVRRWVAVLTGPGARPIDILPESPLRLRIDGRIRPGQNVSFFYRDFPHPVTDIRGDVSADETGFYLRNVLASWGDAKDVKANGYVKLPHHSPLTIVADVWAPTLDLNDWLEGWGEQPWAERPFIRPPSPRSSKTEPDLDVLIECAMNLGRTKFLTVPAQGVTANMRYEAWDGADNVLALGSVQGTIYGGRITGDATLRFPFGGRLTQMEAVTHVEGGEVRGFLEDLLEEPQRFHGKFTGGGNVRGEIGDYSTWTGDGEFRIEESSFIGGQVFNRLSRSLKLGREETLEDTVFTGSVLIRDLQARFPDLRIQSKAIRMIADGLVDFSGNLDFLITVDVISNRFEKTPLLGRLSDLLSRITNFLVSLRLQGTVQEPVVTTVPLQLDRAGFFQEEGAKAVRTAREAMEAGEGVLGRGLRFATQPLQRPSASPTPTATPKP